MYHIKEVAQITQIPQSKIRYYEKEGLIPKVFRDKNNIRMFTNEDIELINLVKCLRTIGMPMKKIRENISLLLDKNSNLTTKEILIDHKEKLENQRNTLKKYINEINKKLKTEIYD